MTLAKMVDRSIYCFANLSIIILNEHQNSLPK